MRIVLLLLVAVVHVGAAGCGEQSEPAVDGAPPPAAETSIYVTLVGHLEDSPQYANCDRYPMVRARLMEFMDLIQEAEVPFNLQVEYEFFLGASRCETEALMATTGGLNILDYLATERGIEIDAHQEGAWEAPMSDTPDNYADIRYLGAQVTSRISENVGGILWDNAEQFARLRDGEIGLLHPAFTWLPDVLTMAVSQQHHEGDFTIDDRTSGVWRPSGAGESFWADNPAARMVYIGPGQHHSSWGPRACYFNHAFEYAEVLLRYVDEGRLAAGRMYTATQAFPQSVMLDATRHDEVRSILAAGAPLVTSGQVRLQTYSEVAASWRADFASEPSVVRFEQIEASDYTCDRTP